MKTRLIPNIQVSAVATYGRPPAWHAFVPQHPAECCCRRTPVAPWPGTPLLPPRRRLGRRP